MAMSLKSTVVNKTGSWRYLKPIAGESIPPCNESCWVSQDIERMIYYVTKRKFHEAYAQLSIENPMPSVLGRVCPHPCEESCNRKQFDEPVSIQALERFIGDWGLKHGRSSTRFRVVRREEVAVIGSGPAGLSCAYHLSRMGYKVTIFEAMPLLGGKLRWAIPDYRLPKRILDQEIDKILSFGIRVEKNTKVDQDIFLKELKPYQAIFIAIGAQTPIPLNIPGENSRGVVSGLEILKAFHLKNKTELGSNPVIIGGGNTAIDVARTALRLGHKPLILYRRSKDEMPAYREEIEEAEGEGIEIYCHVVPVKILQEKGQVVGIECLKMKPGKLDISGRKTPIPIKGSNFVIKTDQVIKAIGEKIEEPLPIKEVVLKNENIEVTPYLVTSRSGIFAGGDTIAQVRSVGHAVLSGKKAAISIDSYLRGKTLKDVFQRIQIGRKGGVFIESYLNPKKRNFQDKNVVGFNEINTFYFNKIPRIQEKHSPKEKATQSFDEVIMGLDQTEAVQSAERCFQCGVCNRCRNCYFFCPDVAIFMKKEGLAIDYDHCKGCGICAQECPRGVIVLKGEN